MKKKKRKILPAIILLVLLIAVVGISIFSLSAEKPEAPSKPDIKDPEKKPEDKPENDTHANFIIEEEANIYVANEQYFVDGSKELIAQDSNALTEGALYNNKFYYINNQSKLVVYDITKKSKKEYNVAETGLHANTLIMPGDKYTIITDCNNFVRVDLEKNEYKRLSINTRNYIMTYDDKEKTVYYSSGNMIDMYDVEKEKTKGPINIYGGAVYVDNEDVYVDLFDYNGYKRYNKKSKDIFNLDITDQWPGNSTINTFYKKNNNIYILMGDYDVLIEYSNNKESFIHEGNLLDFIYLDNKIYIEDYIFDRTDFESSGGTKKYYIYDVATKTKTETTNEHVASLFKSKFYFE